MSRIPIIVTIEPQDETRCGECGALTLGVEGQVTCAWSERQFGAVYFRGPECLAAERKLRALLDAGEAMRLSDGPSDVMNSAWDRAVAGIGEGGES